MVWDVLFHVLLKLTRLGQLVERSGVPRRAEGARAEPAAAAGSLLLPPLPGQRRLRQQGRRQARPEAAQSIRNMVPSKTATPALCCPLPLRPYS